MGAIARELGISRRTIERWNRVGGVPERKPRRRPLSPLAPLAEYLTQRWAEGCHTGLHLWREVRARGYDGPQKAIWPVLHRLRRGLPASGVTDPPPMRRPVRRPPSPRRMAGIVLRRPAERTPAEQQALTRLVALRPAIGSAVAVAERFTTLARERRPAALEQWLADADASGLPSLRRLAAGLERDKAAVLAAVALPYSNGRTEGQITKLKLLKRSMYGRASFHLLRRRVLLAA